MVPNFDRFIHFATVADKTTRQQLANSIFEDLRNRNEKFFAPAIRNFSSAIEEITNRTNLKEMCCGNEELSEKITTDILDFVNKTQKQIDKTENPFEDERHLLERFEKTTQTDFGTDWKQTKDFILKNYDKQALDGEFYEKEFGKSFIKKGIADQARRDGKTLHNDGVSFDSVKEHFTEKWNALLTKKELDWELEIINCERKKFCKELYRKIDELKKLQEILSPFTNKLGQLWDMSSGHWQQTNFDILKHYAELMQRDKSIRELAEMLGQMQQAEQEYEEELFTDIQLKTQWKVESASKADIVGIRESDDISSLLPSEIVLLANPTTEMLFYQKFAEKKLQTFDHQARILAYEEEQFQNRRMKAKEDKKGPFIICVDTSGSMHGTPETVAKTLCFAILKIAVRENRKCYLISFSTGIETLNLTDFKNSLDKVILFLQMSFSGGTDATPAMHECLRMLETKDYKKADVIMVSDFVMPAFDENAQEQIVKAKENKTKFHSLVIGTSLNNSITKDFDNNWLYDTNNAKGVSDMVKNINNLNAPR